MALLAVYVAVLLVFTGRVEASFGVQIMPLKDVNIVPMKAYVCENFDPAVEFNSNLRNINDQGDKVMDISFEMEEEFNENWLLTIVVDRWNNGDWEKDFYNLKGGACELLLKYGEKGWDKFRRGVEPIIPEKCFIEVGSYAITNFTMKVEDLVLPAAVLGEYRVTARVVNAVKEELMCYVFEVEITPA